MADPEKKGTSRKEALAMIWAAYRASLPYILLLVGGMILVTWLITEVFF